MVFILADSCRFGGRIQEASILGIDYAMHGMTVFSDEPDAFYPGYP
ncbi:MAG: hypothetical protein MR487_12835 [Lachnospiraceae bacterium]|nr:hypothetical protein [Lachnospiraceae bacterium]